MAQINSDLHAKPASGPASSPSRTASAKFLLWTLLASTLFGASLTLLSIAAFARAAARKPAAPDWPMYDPATGIASIRRGAVVQFETNGPSLACTGELTRSPAGRVVCPKNYGAVGGSCGDTAPGELLVNGEGTGWSCPKPESVRKGAVTASVLCCKYSRRPR